ncbi:hypothetical protein EON65_51760 [archaeon]|nr:MAG: hypothetical protein EON65_51760 [archaeon]
MFRNCDYLNDRASFLALVALHMPVDESMRSTVGLSEKITAQSWSLFVLHTLQQELEVQNKYFQAYLPLVPRDYVSSNTDCVEAFVNTLRLTNVQCVDLVIRLLLFLLSIGRMAC